MKSVHTRVEVEFDEKSTFCRIRLRRECVRDLIDLHYMLKKREQETLKKFLALSFHHSSCCTNLFGIDVRSMQIQLETCT